MKTFRRSLLASLALAAAAALSLSPLSAQAQGA